MPKAKKQKPWTPKEPSFGSDLLIGVVGSLVIIALIFMI
jgi:hypothetical protein